MSALKLLVALLRRFLATRAALLVENLALRHQLAVLQRSVKRPRLRALGLAVPAVAWFGMRRDTPEEQRDDLPQTHLVSLLRSRRGK